MPDQIPRDATAMYLLSRIALLKDFSTSQQKPNATNRIYTTERDKGHILGGPRDQVINFFFAYITFFCNEDTILKLWEMVERIINYVYLLHLVKNSEEIKYG